MKLLQRIQLQVLRFYTFVTLKATLKLGLYLMAHVDDAVVEELLKEVAETKDAKDSVIVLLRKLKAILDADTGEDATVKVAQASALLDQYQMEIAQAVVENTPADPVPPNLKVPE